MEVKQIKAKIRYKRIRDNNIKTILKFFNVDKLSCHRCDNHNNEEFGFFDFHHMNPKDKVSSISYLMGHVNEKKLINELKKCEVLCPSCHRLHHLEEQKQKEIENEKEYERKISEINLLR